MDVKHTLMHTEAAQASQAVRAQITANNDIFKSLGERLRGNKPQLVVTIGRGSSDHACTYARYLIETELGIIASSAGPSVGSVYGTPLGAQNALSITISQSGQSPDLIAATRNLKGAYSIALVNSENSPLAKAVDQTIPLLAGLERSVAATKTFIASMSAIALLIAHWKNDQELLKQLGQLPDLLDAAWALDWSAAIPVSASTGNLFVLGRGLGYGLAREAALKFKETCALHAESFSAAEVLHGPAALIKPGFPVLALSQNDATRDGFSKTISALASNGAAVFAAGISAPNITTLPTIDAHPVLEPILMAQSYYKMVNAVAIKRGYNPDQPDNLSKVTQTI